MGLGSTVSSSGALAQVSGRDSWKATASNNNNNAKNALDGNAATRWDTSGSQTPGQWFMVDFGKTLTYNTIICDVGSSTSSDAPAAYEIYVSSNGTDWGNAIASGTTTNGIIKVNVQNSKYIRVVQTGSKSNYWSIHEFYVLNAAANNDLISDEDESKTPEETTTVEPTTKPQETTTVEPKGEFISNDVKVIGYQISAVLRGSRVLYSSESTIKGQKVVSSGLIYGFANGPITKDDVVLNSSNKYIASYEATSKGIIANYNGDSATATYYARTMTHNGYGAARYNAKYYVRAYSVLENGAIAYSEVYDFSLYSIADTLYQNNLMPTYDGHQYLFYNILTVVDPDYKEIPYKWNNTISK
ncbi:discoidin domain-containing protein [uncultured Eubacterium sp.]|uniref:discoidin domain-containing protein n=1 Tax=uncultured Eubacterium sp. TaxID=165185 RepID=UPI003265B09E